MIVLSFLLCKFQHSFNHFLIFFSVKSCFQNMEICKRRVHMYDTVSQIKSPFTTHVAPNTSTNLTMSFSNQLNTVHNQVLREWLGSSSRNRAEGSKAKRPVLGLFFCFCCFVLLLLKHFLFEGLSKLAQQVKVLAMQACDLCFIMRFTVEGENWFPKVSSDSGTHIPTLQVLLCTHTFSNNEGQFRDSVSSIEEKRNFYLANVTNNQLDWRPCQSCADSI